MESIRPVLSTWQIKMFLNLSNTLQYQTMWQCKYFHSLSSNSPGMNALKLHHITKIIIIKKKITVSRFQLTLTRQMLLTNSKLTVWKRAIGVKQLFEIRHITYLIAHMSDVHITFWGFKWARASSVLLYIMASSFTVGCYGEGTPLGWYVHLAYESFSVETT